MNRYMWDVFLTATAIVCVLGIVVLLIVLAYLVFA
ncbi:hypothetical protein GYMC52_2945 [Geobacillus sp. Y412MC52]|nr:hypothetical protein GYMC52_2945 [Geobacillus sp. Y412MC52]